MSAWCAEARSSGGECATYVNAAIREDVTWRYSEAFLKAYKGDLVGRYVSYRAAFRGACDDTVPIQSEEFVLEVISQEPDKSALHFCTGLINYHAKRDWASAIREFRLFVSKSDFR
jgi:hypothetical protein